MASENIGPVALSIGILEEYRLYLFCIVYEIEHCRHSVERITWWFENSKKLKDMGLRITSSDLKEWKTIYDEARVNLENDLKRLEEPLSLGLGDYINSIESALEHDREIKRLHIQGDTDGKVGRRDRVFLCRLEAFNHFEPMERAFPLWRQLHVKMAAKFDASPGNNEYSHVLFVLFMTFSQIRRREHLAYICDRVVFRCRFLDDELSNMARLVRRLCPDLTEELLEVFVLDDLNSVRTMCNLSTQDTFLLECTIARGYRFVVNNMMDEHELADRWLRVVFERTPDRNDVDVLLRDTDSCLLAKDSSKPLEGRIELNGMLEGFDTEYTFPVFKRDEDAGEERTKPWWEVRFKRKEPAARKVFVPTPIVARPSNKFSEKNRTIITTLVVSESSSDEDEVASGLVRARLAKEADLHKNQQATKRLREGDSISNHDMLNVHIPYVDLDVPERIVLETEDHKRTTNLTRGGMYHCLRLAYNSLENEWTVESDLCKVRDVMSVEPQGANREALEGVTRDTFFDIVTDKTVLKQYRRADMHKFDNYLADVRTHQIARYYADRFLERVENRIRVLLILDADLLLLFENGHRRTISEFMTVEQYVKAGESNLPAELIKFTSNGPDRNENADTSLAEAFSHFTYDDSDGVLIVTDIQGWLIDIDIGVVYCLTDPAVICPEAYRFFSNANTREEGMQAFFGTVHTECNDICRELGLKQPIPGSWL